MAPSRARGQSFLKDARVAQRQVMAAAVGPGDEVLEVGGGLGVLTGELARRGARVRVVEVDSRLAAHLRSLALHQVEVVEGDALVAPLGRPGKVVANIPYAIATPLIERLTGLGAALIVLLVQREVAARLAARPGSKAWARLPAIVQRDYTVEIVEEVPPSAFFPQPVVRSAVVRLRAQGAARAAGRDDYRAVVGALFAARRKKVRNSAARAASALGVPPAQALEVVEAQGIQDRRPEELSVAQFERLVDALARLRMTK